MATSIPRLTDATTVNASDDLIVQQGGVTKRATAAELAKGLNAINGTVNVQDFGAVGDGVADDTAAIQAADLFVLGGGSITFQRGKVYRCTSGLQFANASVINLNGSTLMADSTVSGVFVRQGAQLRSYTAGTDYTAFTSAINASSFTVPAGVVVNVGEILFLTSNTDRITSYKHGMVATVLAVSGGVATISQPFYAAYQIDGIAVWRGYSSVHISNGTIDFSNAPSSVMQHIALSVTANNADIRGLTIKGSANAAQGILLTADNGIIQNCSVSGFLNTQGIGGGGRVGYGISVEGNNIEVRNCKVFDCKHAVTSAGRTIVTRGLTFSRLTAHDNIAANTSLYTGTIDLHYNVLGQTRIEDCEVVGKNKLLNLRCPNVIVSGGNYVCAVGDYAQGASIIDSFEEPVNNVLIENITYSLPASNASVLKVWAPADNGQAGVTNVTFVGCRSASNSGTLLSVTEGAAVTQSVTIDRCIHSGGELVNITNGNINGLYIRRSRATAVGQAVTIQPDGASKTISNIVLAENHFVRTGYTGALDLVRVRSISNTKLPVSNMLIGDNTFEHTSDTGTGYSLYLDRLDANGIAIRNNIMKRGSFRALTINGTDLNYSVVSGNSSDGSAFVSASSVSSNMASAAFSANAFSEFQVLGGVTRATLVQSGNAITTGGSYVINAGVVQLLNGLALISVDTEANAASDDLDTINGGATGQVVTIRANNSARTVVAKDGTGNLKLAGDFSLDNSEDTLTLLYNGSAWIELSRSDNAA